jgi:hypothetical protein
VDFKTMLEELKKRGQPVNVALPEIGVVPVTISSVSDDVVALERAAPAQKFFLHYTAVIVVT